MDTFGRCPSEINNYIQSLYFSPIIKIIPLNTYTHQFEIKYPYSHTKYNIETPLYCKSLQQTYCDEKIYNQLDEFIKDMVHNKPCQYNSRHNLTIKVNQDIQINISSNIFIQLNINCKDELIKSLTEYKNYLSSYPMLRIL
jgi:hypothetical protein